MRSWPKNVVPSSDLAPSACKVSTAERREIVYVEPVANLWDGAFMFANGQQIIMGYERCEIVYVAPVAIPWDGGLVFGNGQTGSQ